MFKVSVIIPVFNRENFVKNCVSSVLKLPQAGEIILIDDGSSDNSYYICQELASTDPIIKLLTHPNRINKGVSASRNLGIKEAKFDFIAFLDSDDVFLDHRFQNDEKVFENNFEADVTYSLSEICYKNGNRKPFGTSLNTVDIGRKDDFYRIVLKREIILGHISSVTFRKSIFHNLNIWFDERLKIHEDTELWNRIARKYFFYPSELNKPVSIYFQHELNTISNRSKQSELKFLIVFIDNIGLKNLYSFEKKYIVYHFSRTFSNPIKNNFLRRSALHGILFFLNPFKNLFVSVFFSWGLRFFKFNK